MYSNTFFFYGIWSYLREVSLKWWFVKIIPVFPVLFPLFRSTCAKNSYFDICNNYEVTPTLTEEKADERLIKKLRDDPNCFVITNDSYDEYELTGLEKERLIRFERTGSNYNFEMENGSKFIDHLKTIDNEIKKFLNITPFHDLGKWPKVSFDESEIQLFSIKFSHKLIEEEGREQEKQG